MNMPYVRGAIVGLTLICATVLTALGDITETAFIALATLMLGYVFGKASNGVEGIVKIIAAMNTPPAKKVQIAEPTVEG